MQKSFGEKQECPTANTRACIASFITSTTKCSVIIPASLETTGELQAPHIAACTSILLGKNFKGGFTSEKRIKLGILLFIIATTLSLILLGCSQEPFNNNVRENKAKEQPISKESLQNPEIILESLKSASPEEVIQAFFWGHSNHSKEVVNATLYHEYEKINSDYPEIKQWEVLQITKLLNPPEWLKDSEKQFNQVEYFKVKHRLTLNPGYDLSNTQLAEIAERGEIEWYFVLAKERGSRWFIVYYGN